MPKDNNIGQKNRHFHQKHHRWRTIRKIYYRIFRSRGLRKDLFYLIMIFGTIVMIVILWFIFR